MIFGNRKNSNRRAGKWRGLEPLETRVLMSADSLLAVDAGAETSAAVVEDSLQVNETQPERVSVQYRESDFNFVSRLLEEEGIFYFFKHEDGKHTLVLTGEPGLGQEANLLKTFTPGGRFKIQEHRSDSEEGRTYIVTSITHVATEPTAYDTDTQTTDDYQNVFSAIPDSVTFRPTAVTPKPLVHEIQTSVVTGPAGEEIYPDEFGRVRLQFNWDQGETDENSSCWIRVSEVHAGKTFGDIDIPRIGEEVIVAYEQGDPDRPIIVGRVYHAETMPSYGLPGAKNVSGLKSNSTQGSGGLNEFILDDTKGNEAIREHGQFDKDSTIEHVLNDRSRDVTNNETITIGVDRTETVGEDDTQHVGPNRTLTVEKNESVAVALMRTHTVGVNEMINVGAAQQDARILTLSFCQ